MSKVVADLHLMVEYRASDSWQIAQRSDLSQLLRQGLLVRKVGLVTSAWHFCLGNMFSAGCVLEAVLHQFMPGESCWALAPLCKRRIKMWVVLDPDGFESQPIERRTP